MSQLWGNSLRWEAVDIAQEEVHGSQAEQLFYLAQSVQKYGVTFRIGGGWLNAESGQNRVGLVLDLFGAHEPLPSGAHDGDCSGCTALRQALHDVASSALPQERSGCVHRIETPSPFVPASSVHAAPHASKLTITLARQNYADLNCFEELGRRLQVLGVLEAPPVKTGDHS